MCTCTNVCMYCAYMYMCVYECVYVYVCVCVCESWMKGVIFLHQNQVNLDFIQTLGFNSYKIMKNKQKDFSTVHGKSKEKIFKCHHSPFLPLDVYILKLPFCLLQSKFLYYVPRSRSLDKNSTTFAYFCSSIFPGFLALKRSGGNLFVCVCVCYMV